MTSSCDIGNPSLNNSSDVAEVILADGQIVEAHYDRYTSSEDEHAITYVSDIKVRYIDQEILLRLAKDAIEKLEVGKVIFEI